MTNKPVIFGVTGWKNSGKTRMVAALVRELSARGMKVSTVKHAHHTFDIDHEGTDSWQHRKAGASEVALVSRNRSAIMHELQNEEEPSLADILAKLAPCDVIIIEGFKREGHAKIEMIREGASKNAPLWPDDPSIIAIGSDQDKGNFPLPVFHPDNVSAIADFFINKMIVGQHVAD